jgi:hypothetical protein
VHGELGLDDLYVEHGDVRAGFVRRFDCGEQCSVGQCVWLHGAEPLREMRRRVLWVCDRDVHS